MVASVIKFFAKLSVNSNALILRPGAGQSETF